MAKKKANQPRSISNRRARFDYELGDSLVVGLELTGGEAKSLRMGHGHLRGSYVTIKANELFLINATITGSSGISISESDQTRARKILAKRREIDALVDTKQQGKTIVPLELLTGGKYIKLRIAMGKGKKNYDKRQSLKAKDDSRRANAAMKAYR
jgi:SsrA-binding protein